jgi:hypothetical protein
MALTTYSGLKTALANWLNRTDLTSEIADDFIKLAESDFNAKLRIRQMEQIDAITIDSETETVPTGFIGVRSFYILASSTKYVLEYITPHNMFEIKAGSTTARLESIQLRVIMKLKPYDLGLPLILLILGTYHIIKVSQLFQILIQQITF